jgi:hypothetical protein
MKSANVNQGKQRKGFQKKTVSQKEAKQKDVTGNNFNINWNGTNGKIETRLAYVAMHSCESAYNRCRSNILSHYTIQTAVFTCLKSKYPPLVTTQQSF